VAPLIATLSVYVLVRHRRQAPGYALIGLSIAGIFCAWSQYIYGSLLPPYYRGYQPQPVRIAGLIWDPSAALVGNLVSPNRGLFVFVPVFVFSVWGIVHAFRSNGRSRSRCAEQREGGIREPRELRDAPGVVGRNVRVPQCWGRTSELGRRPAGAQPFGSGGSRAWIARWDRATRTARGADTIGTDSIDCLRIDTKGL